MSKRYTYKIIKTFFREPAEFYIQNTIKYEINFVEYYLHGYFFYITTHDVYKDNLITILMDENNIKVIPISFLVNCFATCFGLEIYLCFILDSFNENTLKVCFSSLPSLSTITLSFNIYSVALLPLSYVIGEILLQTN